ncbi:MAG: type IV toxin-antitoxin system AbiEi family antitoxin [Candidatus Eisenbacteria bacterium]|nr:type IV toxin-antitoxin system AbiEi family antitoxin [Candidatus Eisenbacteria bacterium]
MNTSQEPREEDESGQEFLLDALDAFRRETHLNVERCQGDIAADGRQIDTMIRLKAQQREIRFCVEMKTGVTDTVIGRLAHQFEEYSGKWLVVTPHVPQRLARKLRDLNIQFMDTVGNAYINEPPIFIFINGNKPQRRLQLTSEEGMLGRAGLHVVFALLCKRELENAPYRDIAEVADVALGTVAAVVKDLLRQGYMIEKQEGGRKLTRKKELLDKWTIAYAERVRRKTLIGRYTAIRPEFWQDVDLVPYDAQWGGEVAADRMVHYVRPEIVTIYARRPLNDLLLALKLRKNQEGHVELRQRFWKFELNELRRDLVPPLLVYADLLATADVRNVETARMIYNEYLQKHLKED